MAGIVRCLITTSLFLSQHRGSLAFVPSSCLSRPQCGKTNLVRYKPPFALPSSLHPKIEDGLNGGKVQDPFNADAPTTHIGVFLSRDLDKRISSVLLSDNTPPPADALPIVVEELRELLIPPGESGRVSIWTRNSVNIEMVATSAQNEGEDALEGVDAAFDARDRSFLYGLTRDESEYGLFKSKREIEDHGVPNSPGYDQLIYAACLHRGTIIAVIGVGRKFPPGAGHSSWGDVHLACVRAVADMLECAFIQVEGEGLSAHVDDSCSTHFDFVREKCTLDEQYKEVSSVLGEVSRRCANHGILSVALWEKDHDGTWLLYPGRRSRETVMEDFVETSIESCEVIKSDAPRLDFLLARMDSVTVVCSDDENHGARNTAVLEDWAKEIWRQSDNVDSPMTRQIGGFSSTDEFDGGDVIKSNKARLRINSHVATKLSGVMNPSQIVVVPIFFRGDLCAHVCFAFDADAAKDPANMSALFHHAMFCRKKMKSLSWKMQMLSPHIDLPNMGSLISTIRSGNAVALTGAGFSLPANLMSWSGLLFALLEKAKHASKVDKVQYDYIEELISDGTAESYDQAAQNLEESLGREAMQAEMANLLAIDSASMPRVMQRRIKVFNDIPWKVVLTTNYDLSASGPTPRCSDVGGVYIKSLRQGTRRIGEQLMKSEKPPVIKLHGCVNRGNIVFTRSGYRDLLYRVGGYQVFLQSLMASSTFVSLGHSGTDNYFNELYSELLSMFGASNLPLRYSIAPVSEGRASFAKRYDGLNFITWDKSMYGWGVVDNVLQKLRQETNSRVRMANLLRGRRVLLVDSPNSQPLGGWTLADLAALLFQIQPSANVRILSDPTKLQQYIFNSISRAEPFDIVLVVYDEETTKMGVESIGRSTELGNQAPVGVIRSNCSGCNPGFLDLQGSVLPMVIRDMEDAAEELYLFLHRAKAIHRDRHIHLEKQVAEPNEASLQAFL